jgi:chromosome partitioning protein
LVISLINQKGGVGKTTSTMNLGWALITKKKKVLMIDFDPQGSFDNCYGPGPGINETYYL